MSSTDKLVGTAQAAFSAFVVFCGGLVAIGVFGIVAKILWLSFMMGWNLL